MPREAVLCAWAITEDGRKVLLHLAPGTKEDTASCTAFFEDLKRRGVLRQNVVRLPGRTFPARPTSDWMESLDEAFEGVRLAIRGTGRALSTAEDGQEER